MLDKKSDMIITNATTTSSLLEIMKGQPVILEFNNDELTKKASVFIDEITKGKYNYWIFDIDRENISFKLTEADINATMFSFEVNNTKFMLIN